MGLRRKLNDTATTWSVTSDGFGGFTFGSPVTIRCRWEDKSELFRDPTGDEVVSNAVVFLESDVVVGDYLYHGTSTEADPVAAHGSLAQRIKQFNKIPDLRSVEQLRKAFL